MQSAQTADHALIANASSPIPNNPANNPDWAFPSYIPVPSASATSEEKFQDLVNIFPQGLDLFNPLSIMNTNPAEPIQSIDSMAVNRGSAQAERAAKQKKLLEIQETARQLEAELAASYVP